MGQGAPWWTNYPMDGSLYVAWFPTPAIGIRLGKKHYIIGPYMDREGPV